MPHYFCDFLTEVKDEGAVETRYGRTGVVVRYGTK